MICSAHCIVTADLASPLLARSGPEPETGRPERQRDDRMLFTARSTFTASYFRPRSVLLRDVVPRRPAALEGRKGGQGAEEEEQEEAGRGCDSILASFHPLVHFGARRGEERRGGERRSAAANYLSSVLRPPSCSFRKVRFRSVPFLSPLSLLSHLSSREEGEEGKQHTRLPC